MNKRNFLKSRMAGSAMALALLVILLLSVVGIGLLNLGFQSRVLAIEDATEISARCAADAALTKALYEMNEKLEVQPWNDNVLPSAENMQLLGSDATYSYTVTGDTDSGFTVEAVGRSGLTERRVTATLRLRGMFDNAVYAEESILVENHSLIDGGSAGVATHPDGSGTTVLHQADIEGQIRSEEMDLPMISPPEYPPFNNPRAPIVGSTIMLPTGNGQYESIELRTGDKLEFLPTPDFVDMPDHIGEITLYVTGDAVAQQFSELVIDEQANLVLYLGGDLLLRNRTLFNTLAQDPKKCLILGVGGNDGMQELVFDNQVVLYGVIYAPRAHVRLDNNTEVHGAIVARSVEVSNESELYYDESLSEASVTDIGVKFVVDRWQEQ